MKYKYNGILPIVLLIEDSLVNVSNGGIIEANSPPTSEFTPVEVPVSISKTVSKEAKPKRTKKARKKVRKSTDGDQTETRSLG